MTITFKQIYMDLKINASETMANVLLLHGPIKHSGGCSAVETF